MATFDELITRLSEDSLKRGRQFEQICVWYLKNAPQYKKQFSKVCLFEEWPKRWGAGSSRV